MKQIFAHKRLNDLTDGELDLVCAMLHDEALTVCRYYPEGFEKGPRVFVRPTQCEPFTVPTEFSAIANQRTLIDVIAKNNIYSMKLNRTNGRWKVRSKHVKTYDTRLEKAVVMNVIIQQFSNLSEDISVMVDDHKQYKFGVVK